MPISITRNGTHKLQKSDGSQISSHSAKEEAYEKASSQPNGTYKLITADETIVVSGTTPTPPPNQAPSITLTSPAPGSSVVVGTAVTLSASASDPDGTIAGVIFVANGQTGIADTVAPYTTQWTPLTAGTHVIVAVAKDNAGATTSSASVSLTATAPPTPTPGVRTLLTQADLRFLGGFRVSDKDFRLAPGGGGIAARVTPNGQTVVLLGQNGSEYVVPATLGTGSHGAWPTVTSARDFVASWNGKLTFSRGGALGQDPAYGRGLYWDSVDQRLYVTIGYGVDDYLANGPTTGTTLIRADLDPTTDKVNGVAAYAVPDRGFKRVSGGLRRIPQWYADQYLGGKSLAIGDGGYRSILSFADVSLGPALAAIAPPSGAHLAPTGPSTDLLHFVGTNAPRPNTGGYAYSADASVGGNNTGVYQWSDTGYQTMAWIDTGTKHGVLSLFLVGIGSMVYHQSGSFAGQSRLLCQIWDPLTFAPVTGGSPTAPRPAAAWNPTLPGWTDPNSGAPDWSYAPAITSFGNRVYIKLTTPGAVNYPGSITTVYVYEVTP